MTRRETLGFFASVLGASVPVWQGKAQGALTLAPLTDNLSVLSGAGGNITVLHSSDGLLLLDSGLPDNATAVLSKSKEASAAGIQQLINTHWHNDHTGGNTAMGQAGARIMAHENCAKRLATTQHMMFFKRDVAALAPAGQPKQTFKDSQQLSFAGQTLKCQYFPPAHTDGDVTVHFQEANVYTTGDLFFNGIYPFIDYSSGGSIEGMIRNSAAMLKVVGDETKIVPGHGPIGTKAQLQQSHDMLADVNEQISKMVAAGKTAEEIAAAAPTQKYDAQFGNGFLKPAAWVGMLCQGKLMNRSKAA